MMSMKATKKAVMIVGSAPGYWKDIELELPFLTTLCAVISFSSNDDYLVSLKR